MVRRQGSCHTMGAEENTPRVSPGNPLLNSNGKESSTAITASEEHGGLGAQSSQR